MADKNYKPYRCEIKGPHEFDDGPWSSYIDYLTKSLKQIEDLGVVNMKIEYQVCWGDYQPAEYFVVGQKPLTEIEITRRKEKEKEERRKKAAVKQEALKKEREEYERLKLKFEN